MCFHELKLKLVSRTDNFLLKLRQTQLVCYCTVLFGKAPQKIHWQPHGRNVRCSSLCKYIYIEFLEVFSELSGAQINSTVVVYNSYCNRWITMHKSLHAYYKAGWAKLLNRIPGILASRAVSHYSKAFLFHYYLRLLIHWSRKLVSFCWSEKYLIHSLKYYFVSCKYHHY